MDDQAVVQRPALSVRAVLIWAAVLAAVTAAVALWLQASGGDYRDASPAVIVIAYAPGCLAVMVAAVRGGGAATVLRQFARWRVGIGWYVIVLVGPVFLVLVVSGVVVLSGGPVPATWLALPSAAGVPALLGPLIAGSLGEEPGWRGFAQRRLQRPAGMLIAAIIVGLLWSCWHLWPLLTVQGRSSISTADVLTTFLRLISTSVVYAWLYQRTKGSLPIVMLAHAGHNVAIDLMPSTIASWPATAWIIAGLYAVAALAVVWLDPGPTGRHRDHPWQTSPGAARSRSA